MRYRDLVEFEPLETIVQLREADDKEEARTLVRSYVISERMAKRLTDLVIPQLRLDRAADSKGIFVVGNYGTGKSHLMSALSAVAEHADLAAELRNPAVREAAQAIAGQFKVVRAELGGVTRSLRASILDELEIFLAAAGTPYTFPAIDAVSNNKDSLIEAVAGFRAQYPDYGILFVLDELLDYLRGRDERELILDLGFLRELGEVVELTPLRFVAGVQESLFDSPRFAFVADQLRRVRDRFEQVRIAREDVAFVVAERLLRKSDAQIALIAEHLRQFTDLYPPMGDRLEDFARLFPIHPAYIETFEQVYVAEKREILKTFSNAIRRVLDDEVPTDQTGLISFDHYWGVIKDNPSLRTAVGVIDVVEKSDVLAGRIRSAYTRPALLPLAQRIIDALSVQRLTTSDVNAPLGVTIEELRDKLCLWTPLPERDAQFLADTIQVALKEIMRTVSGQYISFNAENGQYYLDLHKVIDFDANIANRGAILDDGTLNRYYFDALQQIFVGLPTSVHVAGYRIWRYELPWAEKMVTRPGYLFFGLPNQRSTAQPPRDFYVYIIPPFGPNAGQAIDQAAAGAAEDEVLFALRGFGAEFEEIVRSFAGARLMADQSPAHAHNYEDKADGHLRRLKRWFADNAPSRLQAIYRGVTYSLPEALARTQSSAGEDIEEVLRIIAASFLAPMFGDRYADYPGFTRLREPISEAARPASAMDAIRYIARQMRTNLAINVLDGLGLVDDTEAIKPLQSPYARHLLNLLAQKEENQVVNHGEVMEQLAGGLEPISKERRYQLEPEWVAAILVALVYDGQIVLNLGGSETLDAGNVERAAAKAIEDLSEFRFYKRPRGLPLPAWQQIFDGLGLQTSLVREESTRNQAVRELQAAVQNELNDVVTWQSKVQDGLSLWNRSLFTDRIEFSSQAGVVVEHSRMAQTSLSQTDLLPALRGTKQFLETLSRFNTAGKLRNLTLPPTEIQEALIHRDQVRHIGAALALIDQLQPLTGYLSEAQATLPPADAWSQEAEAARAELFEGVRRMAKGEGSITAGPWQRRLGQLRSQYVTRYGDLHSEYVLGPAGADRRLRLAEDARVKQARALAALDLFGTSEFDRWREALESIPACREFHPGLLVDRPVCPHCGFRPIQAGSQPADERLNVLEARLELLLEQWHAGLTKALASDTAHQSMASMRADERRPLDAYLVLAEPVEEPLPEGFVTAANKALRGLETVSLDVEALLAALKQGGLPCTAEELEARFGRYVATLLGNHDRRSTRIAIDP